MKSGQRFESRWSNRPGPWPLFGITLVLSVVLAPFARAVPVESERAGVVAYVEEIFAPGSRKLADVAQIDRPGGQKVSKPEDAIYLWPGDRITITAKGADLYVRLIADGRRVRISRAEGKADSVDPDFIVPTPPIPGLPIRIAGFFKTLFLGPDFSGSGLAMSASRGEATGGPCFNASGETNQPRTFDIPSLTADGPALAAGKRELVVSWIGGAPPFTVEVANVETGKTVAAKTAIAGACAVRLPSTTLLRGHYRVSVTDANHASMTEGHLSTETAPPPVPPEIAGAALPAETKELYTATWLAGLNGGRWAFEALQRVSALDCRSLAVKDWLRNWGGLLPKCEDAPGAGPRPAHPTTVSPPTSDTPAPATPPTATTASPRR